MSYESTCWEKSRMNTTKSPLEREFWRPEEGKVWVRKQRGWGWGWTVNWAEVRRRLRPGR
jgi:hypothetical protein